MKRNILSFITAGLMAGLGPAGAQVLEFNAADNDYVSANKNFNSTPTSWKNWESAPASGYSGPSFSYAGLNSSTAALTLARVQQNDRLQHQSGEDFDYMIAFDLDAPARLGRIRMEGSTYGGNPNSSVAGDKTYLLVRDSSQTSSVADGWYATLLHDRTAVSSFDYTVEVASATWYAFTPSTTDGTFPLGTIGAQVDASTVSSKLIDEVGYYADVAYLTSGNANHYLWTLQAYELEAELVLDPADRLDLVVSDADGVTSNALNVSYFEGAGETNVNISSISIVPASSGLSVSPANLMLTQPSPSSQTVWVEFDNVVGGLSPGEGIASGVELIWNEVGSGIDHTSSVPVSVAYPLLDEEVVVAFDDTFTAPDRKLPGVSASISGGLGYNSNYGSTDTSYGSKLGQAPASQNGYGASVNDDTVVVTVSNSTPDTVVVLNSLNFDIGRRWAKAPNRVEISTSGDIDNLANLTNHSGFTEFVTDGTPYIADYDDFDIDLTGLSVNELTYGQTASFTFTFSDPIDGTNPDSIIGLDNIALLGELISSTLLTTDPENELALNVDDPAGSVTGAVSVSYIEASSMPTNVTITGVSFSDESDSGAFVDVSTNLPFTLNDPSDARDLLVAFNNATAELVSGETATANMNIEWNEVGSATSSTSSLPVSATFLDVYPGNTIAIFEHTGVNANPRLGGLVAQISGYYNTNTDRGSTDGTYGTKTANARIDPGCYQATLSSPVISVAITNNTGNSATFDSLHFDAAKGWAKGPGVVTVTFSGDIPAQTPYVTPGTLPAFSGQPGDYPDFDVPLVGDCTLEHGESMLIQFTYSNGDVSNTNAVSVLDNIALLGSGVNGATLTKVPGGGITLGVASSDTTVSQVVEMFFEEGDVANDIEFNGVSFSSVSHPGAFSATGLIAGLTEPSETNEIVTLVFNNASAQLAAGEMATATMEIAWNETGLPERVFEIPVSVVRPAAPSESGIVALFDTAFLAPDTALDGILGRVEGGDVLVDSAGSTDGTYGDLSSPAAPTEASAWRLNNTNHVVTLTVTNKSSASIPLEGLHFDVGRRWINSPDTFTVSVSGDLTATPNLLTESDILQISGDLADFSDFTAPLSGLADHTLGPNESAVFTFTFVNKGEGLEFFATYIDNIALTTDLDAYGLWAFSVGLTAGVNDGAGDNPDGDGMDNFMEYAANGDPLVADSMSEMWDAEEGGTNWFYHVHDQRVDDPSLTFELGAKNNLVFDPSWDSEAMEWMGETAESEGFKTITNRVEMSAAGFIRLRVEQAD